MKTVSVQLADDEVLVAFKRDEGYEDVHPQLLIEDALGARCPFQHRLVEAAPAAPAFADTEAGAAWDSGYDAGRLHGLAQAKLAPAGYAVVPVEPTIEMLDAGRRACDGGLYPSDFVHGPRAQHRDKWAAMLAAAPAPAPAAPATDRVPMPQNADQAAAMVSLGMAWLEQHAPDRLAAPAAPAPNCGEFPRLAARIRAENAKDTERAELIQRLYDEAQDNPDDYRYRAGQALETASQERAAFIGLAAAASALHTAVHLDWPNSPVTRAKVLKAADGVWMALNDLGTDADPASDQSGIEITESPRPL